jgi:lysophospholipase L1-like esterase
MKTVRRILQRVALVLGTLLFLFLALEVILRVAGARPKTATVLSSFFEYSPTCGWVGQPDIDRRFVTASFDVTVTHDADGLRTCGLRHRIAGDIDYEGEVVWILGDSFAWGWGVDDEHTVAGVLNRAAGRERIYRSLGVPGYGTLQQYLALKDRLEAGQRPDRVVVHFVGNDPLENMRIDGQRPPRPFYDIENGEAKLRNYPVPTSSWSISVWFKQNLLAYNYLHFYLTSAKRVLRPGRGFGGEPGAPQPTPDQLTGLRDAYTRMRDLCAKHEVRLAVATEDRPWLTILGPLCEALGVPLLDLSGPFQGVDRQTYNLQGDHHFNKEGYRLLARGIEAALADAENKARTQR